MHHWVRLVGEWCVVRHEKTLPLPRRAVRPPPSHATERTARRPRGILSRVARRVVVHGRVQGVFFRDSTRRAAESRGVAGWVRNRSDGAVEAWFEGDADAVETMVSWARSGPSRAEVEDADVEDVAPEGLGGFEIR